ncbi:hypothetical protein BGZ93_000567 [Podila epicladia]|nr:hypothetical protein BGZ92_009193 [Podila epicladia]KAG0100479.1 hypothetical protein BGZ93_000567 [Podila epicladia]
MKIGLLTLLLLLLAAAQGGLPPIGAEIPQSIDAVNSALLVGTNRLSVDFLGCIKERIQANSQDPDNSRRLSVVGFKLKGDFKSQDASGTVTIELNNIDSDAGSTSMLLQISPLEFKHINVISVKLTVNENGAEKLVLTSKEPMVLTGMTTRYPPRGDLYGLEKTVEFVSLDDPDTVAAVLETLTAKRGRS